MAELSVPRLDFSILGNFGQTYEAARNRAETQRTLADLGSTLQNGGNVDYTQAAAKALAGGNQALGLQLLTLGSNSANKAFDQNYKNRYLNILEERANKPSIPAGFQAAPNGGLQPIPGGPADPNYKRTTGDRQNAPVGYMWNDPSNPGAGVTAIPGGPAEKISSETAARLGMAKSFLGQLPEIKKQVAAGAITGPIDALAGQGVNVGGFHFGGGYGKAGEINRQIASGAEALLRNLTGAGMNKEEASAYVKRYMPEYNDSAATVLSKLNQLERELTSVMSTVAKGRGGVESVMGNGGAPQPRAMPQAGAPSGVNAPAGAISALRSNPGLRDQFDAKYGAGASAQVLGGP